jgi:hypothetical protein
MGTDKRQDVRTFFFIRAHPCNPWLNSFIGN